MQKITGLLLASTFAFGASGSGILAQESAIDRVTPVTDETLRNPPAGDWLMWRRTYDGWGYSPLDL